MLTWSVFSRSADDTRSIGITLGKLLLAGDFIGLLGGLGAGKTALAKGIAEGAGVDPTDVTSPTFSIVQSYAGRLALHHADLYRLTSKDDLVGTGYFDTIESGGAALVEWVDQVPGARAADGLLIEMVMMGETGRKALASASGPRSTQLLEEWIANHSPPRSTRG